MPTGIYPRKSIEQRFWAGVQKTETCWIWTGDTVKGYGRLRDNVKPILTHRLSWEIAYGPIPNGLCVLHRCDNPPCARPDHLFLGTKLDNMQDSVNKGRHWQVKKTHCPQGHPYSTENTLIQKNGSRKCRTCVNAIRRMPVNHVQPRLAIRGGTMKTTKSRRTTVL